MISLTERWRQLSARIEQCRSHSPAAASEVTLIAVSKTQPAEAIIPLLEAGHRDFGENRVQEAAAKWPPLMAHYPDIRLHLIGSLQSNKVAEALRLFHVIHTVDRESLVDAIVRTEEQVARGEEAKRKEFFVQVNTGEEPQKGGVAPVKLPQLMEYIKNLAPRPSPLISGLMCVPPAHALAAPHFAMLRTLAQSCHLPYLSMGMSGDFETAVRLGATHVRIGTAIFGERR